MTRYATAEALRTALESRLGVRSREANIDLDRLRRGVVFERVLARLEANDPGAWVLKGGAGMELRFRDRARRTKDLDVVLRLADLSGDEIRERLIDAFATDPDGDRFRFAVGRAQPLAVEPGRNRAYRFHVDGLLAGRLFAALRIDVVPRPDELQQTQRIELPGLLRFAGLRDRTVEVVSANQQFAEKLHALTRDYGGEPSSRLRDLLDIVLFLENDAIEQSSLRESIHALFAVRDTHPVPTSLPAVPADWDAAYSVQAADLGLRTRSIAAALETLNDCLRRLDLPPGEDGPRLRVDPETTRE